MLHLYQKLKKFLEVNIPICVREFILSVSSLLSDLSAAATQGNYLITHWVSHHSYLSSGHCDELCGECIVWVYMLVCVYVCVQRKKDKTNTQTWILLVWILKQEIKTGKKGTAKKTWAPFKCNLGLILQIIVIYIYIVMLILTFCPLIISLFGIYLLRSMCLWWKLSAYYMVFVKSIVNQQEQQ